MKFLEKRQSLVYKLFFLVSFASLSTQQLHVNPFDGTQLDTVTGCYPSLDTYYGNITVLTASDRDTGTLNAYVFHNTALAFTAAVTQNQETSRPQSSVKILSSSLYIASWIENTSGNFSVMARICSFTVANGCSKAKFLVSAQSVDAYQPRIAFIKNISTIIISWAEPSSATHYKMMYRLFSVNGTSLGPIQQLASPRVYDPSFYDVGSLWVNNNWRFMFVYSDFTTGPGVTASLVTSQGALENSFDISSQSFNKTVLATHSSGAWLVVGENDISILSIAGVGTSVYASGFVAIGSRPVAGTGGESNQYFFPGVTAMEDERTYVVSTGSTYINSLFTVRDAASVYGCGDTEGDFSAVAAIPGSPYVAWSFCLNSTNQVKSQIGNYNRLGSEVPSPFPTLSPLPSLSPSTTPSVTASPSTQAAASAKNSDTPIIAGVAVGSASVILASAAVLAFVLVKHRKQKDEKIQDQTNMVTNEETGQSPGLASDPSKVIYESGQHSPVQKPKDVAALKLEEGWRIPYSEVTVKGELGRGAFGVVYRCVWHGTDCVVKVLNSETADTATKFSFIKEANAMRKLRNHPNLCLLLGVCDEPMAIFMEFVEGGSLWHCLKTKKIKMTTALAIKFAKDIASGMSHLHAENIIHMDLACRNLLVAGIENNYTIKITDFGLSRVLDPYKEMYIASETAVFPIRWTAIETLNMRIIAKPSDVWSFGITLWELMECKVPYPTMTNVQVMEGLNDGLRPTRPTAIEIPDALWTLMELTWRETPAERPTFNDICNQLELIEKDWLTSQR